MSIPPCKYWIAVKPWYSSANHLRLCYSVFDEIHLSCLGICFAASSLCQISRRRLLLARGCWFLERMKAWQCLSCLKCVSGDSLTKQICAIACSPTRVPASVNKTNCKQKDQLVSQTSLLYGWIKNCLPPRRISGGHCPDPRDNASVQGGQRQLLALLQM